MSPLTPLHVAIQPDTSRFSPKFGETTVEGTREKIVGGSKPKIENYSSPITRNVATSKGDPVTAATILKGIGKGVIGGMVGLLGGIGGAFGGYLEGLGNGVEKGGLVRLVANFTVLGVLNIAQGIYSGACYGYAMGASVIPK